MFENRRISALLLMAGSGFRFGSEVPKQFHLLDGKEVFRYALDTMLESGFFEEIILVCHPEWLDIADLPDHVKVIPGAITRQKSTFVGLKSFSTKPDIVLIHDAVRPFVTQEILRANILAAMQHGAVDTCIPTVDTLVHSSNGQEIDAIPERNTLFRGQTPQTFAYAQIFEAHKKALEDGVENATDDCQLALRCGQKIFMVDGSLENRKITTEFDLHIAEIQVNPLTSPK